MRTMRSKIGVTGSPWAAILEGIVVSDKLACSFYHSQRVFAICALTAPLGCSQQTKMDSVGPGKSASKVVRRITLWSPPRRPQWASAEAAALEIEEAAVR